MMLKRIVYLNTFASGVEHEMFNAGLLSMCAMFELPVVCRTSRSSYNHMCKVAGTINFGSNVKFYGIPTIGGLGRYGLLLRYIWGALLGWLYLFSTTKKTDVIILPFNNLFALKGINFFNKLFKRKIIIFCHGELEFIASDINKKGLLSQWLCHLCRDFFLNPQMQLSRGVYFSVLGDQIKENLRSYLSSELWNKFVVLDHPYWFPSLVEANQDGGAILKLGTCGALSHSKGVDQMVQFSKMVVERKLNVSIMHIGKVYDSVDQLREYAVEIPLRMGELSRIDYNKLISELNYILFFYPPSNYKITASGAIMDAIALGKPIIALRNDYFEYVFEKFGCFGYLVQDVDQMAQTVERISTKQLALRCNFTDIQSKFTPKILFAEFKQMINTIIDLNN